MRILFWGTPVFALPSLRALSGEGHEIVGVVTQPDRPAGRGRRLRHSAVKVAAQVEGHRVLEPEKPRGPELLADIRALEPELSVVVAYGHILPKEVLELPPLGSVNVHASLLPELRGAAPVQWAIIRGHAVSGVSIIRLVEKMDAGPILFQTEEPVGPDETASELEARLAEVGAAALVETLALLEVGEVEEREQDESRVTFAPKINRETARLDWSLSAEEVARWIRGLDADPGAWTVLEGREVKLFGPRALPDHAHAHAPGTVLVADPVDGLLVAAGTGAVRVEEITPEGRRRMSAQACINGRGVRAGQQFV
ncbi:MAG: methionyl-tRNA formyltransferase [Gemmatimonadetes bacterium]|nr:methionyl-tRNA formyltransferase [Gemmatimonadota bacterium]